MMLKVTFGAKERWGRGEVIIGTAGRIPTGPERVDLTTEI